ncbi:MAG: polysaccharide deacetylase family protein [Candidatus Firestonebacteria bacterium]
MFKCIALLFILSFSLFADESWGMILGYHRIVEKRTLHPDVTIDAFKEQMQFVRDNYKVISLDYLVNCIKERKPLEANSVIITFDDGDETIYKNAYPILKRLNFPFAIFLYSDYPGKGGFSWEQAKEMSDNGIIFGSHTKSHAILTDKLADESEEKYLKRLRIELVESKKTIEDNIKKEVKYFAYPYGKHTEIVETEMSKAGYIAATGMAWDRNFVSSASLINLKRRLIPGKYKLNEFVDIFKNTNIDKSSETEHEDYK